MTVSRRPFGAPQPAPIDDIEDEMGSVEPLDFDDEETHEPISDLFTDEERNRHMAGQPSRRAGLSGAALPGDDLNDDDLEPEMLIREDGARDAKEAAEGDDEAADWELSVVDEDDIGAGKGLDEAQLAEIDPVGRKR
ncbi:serine kinase/phosphatase [Pseudomonas saxonica]|nr:serine kinase/phosphatase [Pseudomonas saxonica]WRQ76214.1 serine kinase/phosphatase [Pseudomonas saxonica]